MDKSPDAFRTISEVAEWLDVPTHVLRFWESRFTQVKPVKRAGGRRYYRPSDMALLGGIKKLLHEDGLTIRGVQKVLREQGVKHVAALVPSPGGETIEGTAEPAAIAAPPPPPEVPPVNVPEIEAAPELPLEVAAELAEAPVETVADLSEAEPAEDPDAALRRFPFVDDEPEEAEAESAPEPDEPAAPDEPAEPAPVAFVADVPETDPEDEDESIAVPGALTGLVLPGAAARLAPHGDTLGALHARACALRDRMASHTRAE